MLEVSHRGPTVNETTLALPIQESKGYPILHEGLQLRKLVAGL